MILPSQKFAFRRHPTDPKIGSTLRIRTAGAQLAIPRPEPGYVGTALLLIWPFAETIRERARARPAGKDFVRIDGRRTARDMVNCGICSLLGSNPDRCAQQACWDGQVNNLFPMPRRTARRRWRSRGPNTSRSFDGCQAVVADQADALREVSGGGQLGLILTVAVAPLRQSSDCRKH